ncbi:MAG: hypothetical protein KY459_15375 [Acidobacteria bacterium]|nr:hypothetical protein [Acidobacteriota bacterium]
MRKKVSTVIEESLFRRTKVEALRQEVQISDVITDALEAYLDQRGSPRGPGGIVAQSWRSIPLARSLVEMIMDEEEYDSDTR